MSLKITQNYMTKNDCYTAGRKITPKGVMVHSDGCKAGIKAAGWFSRWNKSGTNACVHAFVDDTECIEYLPTEKNNCHRGWHGGGSSNNTHIGFEMCEPTDYADKAYFEKVYANAVEYTAYLLKKHGITVVNSDTVLCHCEGYKKGIATNHGDVMHWFKYHNKTMDDFRNDVKNKIQGVSTDNSNTSTNVGYTVKITADVLNVRSGPGTNYGVTTTVKENEVYTIVEESNGWGKLKSGAGWISLQYTSKGSSSTSNSSSNTSSISKCDPVVMAPVTEVGGGGRATVTASAIKFRDHYCTHCGTVQGTYNKGESVNYDKKCYTERYVWISWISASTGKRRWMPIRDKKTGEVWATVK